MDFFEDLKRTASSAADKAVKKTTELTGIAKLNLNIKTAQYKLKEVYAEIGKLFYTAERSGVDFTSEIAENIMKADSLIAEINLNKEKLAALRNLTTCEGCGNEIPYSAAFCSFCGMKQEHPEPEVDDDDDAATFNEDADSEASDDTAEE